MNTLPTEQPGEKRVERRFGLLCWLAAAVFAAVAPYIPSLRWPFVLDDGPLIVQDVISHSLDIHQAFGMDFLHGFLTDTPIYYRPLITLSFQANYVTAGPDAFYFRLTNLILNVGVVLCVFALARRLTNSVFASGVAAIAYAVLPSHAESVAWVSGRTDVISALFILASLLAFVAAYRRRPQFSWPLAILTSLLFLCAAFSKESGLMAPLLMAGYVWAFGKSIRRAELLKWVAVFLPPLVFYAILRHRAIGSGMEEYILFKFGDRLAGVGIAYAAYLRMLFVPQGLRVIYDVFPIGIMYPAIEVAAWLLPVGLVALGVWARKRSPVIAFSSLWIFVTLLPVSNIIPTLGPVPAERFVYLASVGSSIIIGWIAWRMYEWRPKAVRTWPVVAVVLVLWFLLYSTALTIWSTRYYESDLAWARGIAESKTRFGAMRSAAARQFFLAGFYKKAAEEYAAAIPRIKDGEPKMEAYIGLAVAKRALGQPEESIDVLVAARGELGESALLEYHLGIDYAVLGQFDQAAEAFRVAVALNPQFRGAWRNLGRAELEVGDYKRAVRSFERAFSKKKVSPMDRLSLAQAYLRAGDAMRARREYSRIVSEDRRGKAGQAASEAMRAMPDM